SGDDSAVSFNGSYTGATTEVSGGTASFGGRYTAGKTVLSGGTMNLNSLNPQGAVPLNVTGTLDMLGGTLKRSDATDAFSGSNGLQIGTGSSIWTGGTVALPALWI